MTNFVHIPYFRHLQFDGFLIILLIVLFSKLTEYKIYILYTGEFGNCKLQITFAFLLPDVVLLE